MKPHTRALVITGALAVLMSAGQVSFAQAQARVGAAPSDLPNINAPADGVAVGHEVQENSAPRPSRYTLRLRLDDGRYRGFQQDSADDLRVSDRVLVENDRIEQERKTAQK
ncbi:MAG: hypothetical protein ABIS68_01750 [Casimicrobiaceae bacterium]